MAQKPKPSGREKRKSPRAAAQIAFYFKFFDRNAQTFDYHTDKEFFTKDIGLNQTRCLNISLGGMAVSAWPDHLIENNVLRIKLSLPEYPELDEILGKIVWTRESPQKNGIYHMGVEFVMARKKDLESLNTFIQKALKQKPTKK